MAKRKAKVKRRLAKINYWGCVRTKPRQEARAAGNVEAQGFSFYRPVMWVPFGNRLRRETMFRGYLFVRMREGWQALASTRGVARVMMAGERPSRVPDREIAFLRNLEDNDGVVVLPPSFAVGSRVRLKGGQRFLRGRVGIVQTLERHRCKVLLSILGRETVKEMAPQQLEALSGGDSS
jgi:transcription antitermination factor NusG